MQYFLLASVFFFKFKTKLVNVSSIVIAIIKLYSREMGCMMSVICGAVRLPLLPSYVVWTNECHGWRYDQQGDLIHFLGIF